MKTKNVYGIFDAEQVNLIKKDNLNFFSMKIHDIRTKTKDKLKEILGEEADIAMRNTSSEIQLKYKMKLFRILKIVKYITFSLYLAHI